MKFKTILLLILLVSSCSRFESENKISLTAPMNSDSNQNNSLKDIIRKNEIQEIEQEKLNLKKEIAELSKASRLSNLETAKIQKNDLEIRVRKRFLWWKTGFLILKRVDDKWSAEYQKQTFYDATTKLKSVSKKEMSKPKSGWGNFWRKLTDAEVLTLADGFLNGGSEPCRDCGDFIIETNVGGDYRICIYTSPTIQSELREKRQVAKIADIIASEFELDEFAAESRSE